MAGRFAHLQLHPKLVWAAVVLSVLLTTSLRYALSPLLGDSAPFLLFTLPVVALALVAGSGPAIATIALAIGPGIYFASSGGTAEGAFVQLLLFLLIGTGIIVLSARLRQFAIAASTAEQHLRSIIDASPVGVILLDEEHIVRSLNLSAQLMFVATEASMGRSFDQLAEVDIGQLFAAGNAEPAPVHRPVEASGIRPDGSRFPIEIAVAPTRRGDLGMLIVFVRDLSAQQAAAERIAELGREVERVGRAGAAGAMASTLAHELNQPIGAASACIQTLLTDVTAGKADLETLSEGLQIASDETMRAGEIIRAMRTYVAEGQVEKTLEEPVAILRETRSLMRRAADRAGAALELNGELGLPTVLVNLVQVQQVLTNLVRNALDAVRAAQVKQVRISATVDQPGFVSFHVEDSGGGLSADIAPRIFDAFATSKSNGLGLGLPISRTIVESHGGRIWVDTSSLGGAAFHVTLPRDPGMADADS